MIGYRISLNELKAKIESNTPGWSKRAEERTEEFRTQGHYQEKSSIWSEIKPVYMDIQGGCKCAFCERKLESKDYGRPELDIEHFRPKKNVKSC